MEKSANWKSVVYDLFKVAGGAAAIIGVVLFIKAQTIDILYSQEYADRMSSKIAPFLIFDESNKILYNSGALEYIGRDVKIQPYSNSTYFDIVVRLEKWLNSDPILTSLDRYDLRMAKPVRKENKYIIYRVYEPAGMVWATSYDIPKEEKAPSRYRLDIVLN